ncbi:MAG TPA: DUF1425 domain-containing protein [Phycisphaerales bacterium]|nr:DUF1425 domain-containing protein [Phycisphaerales bacterium]
MTTRFTNVFSLLAILLAAFAFSACRSSDISPSPGEPDPIPAPENDPVISILVPELRPWLGFHPAIITHEPGRNLHVETPMRNMTYQRHFLQYRYLFYNTSNVEVGPTMPWTRIYAEPKQTLRLIGDATSPDVDHYRLEIKAAK